MCAGAAIGVLKINIRTRNSSNGDSDDDVTRVCNGASENYAVLKKSLVNGYLHKVLFCLSIFQCFPFYIKKITLLHPATTKTILRKCYHVLQSIFY